MNIKNKTKIVKNLVEKISLSNCFYIVDSGGLTAEQVNYFRRLCFNNKIYYSVVKNTLIRKSFKILNKKVCLNFFDKVLRGFSAVLIVKDISAIPAKIMIDFRKYKNINLPILKCAFIDNELFIGNNNLYKLSIIKSKEESIFYIILLLRFPLFNLINLIKSSNKLLMIMNFLSKKK